MYIYIHFIHIPIHKYDTCIYINMIHVCINMIAQTSTPAIRRAGNGLVRRAGLAKLDGKL